MKRLIYSLLPVLLIGATTPARGGSQDVLDLSVIDLMTERELRESGLTKLSPDEMENLDAWLNRFASVFLTIQQTTEGSASPPSQPTAPRPTPGTDAACYESSIMVPTPFMGNDGEIFRLLDGSLWEVKYEYEYLYEYYPDVVVCPARGTLVIDGKTLNVVRISGDAPRSPAQLGGTEDIIESQIDGEFTGWEGDTIFRLQNGQVWQQASYSYRYRYALNPRVVIYQSSAGHKMRVDGVDDEIAVRRLQ